MCAKSNAGYTELKYLFSRYLSGKIREGEAHNITCPGFDCIKLVPVEIIETLVSRDMSRRYLQFDIKVIACWITSNCVDEHLFKKRQGLELDLKNITSIVAM